MGTSYGGIGDRCVREVLPPVNGKSRSGGGRERQGPGEMPCSFIEESLKRVNGRCEEEEAEVAAVQREKAGLFSARRAST